MNSEQTQQRNSRVNPFSKLSASTSESTRETKVEIVDGQLSLIVADITVPIHIVHVFKQNYAFKVDTKTLPRGSLDTHTIIRQICDVFHVRKPEVLEVRRDQVQGVVLRLEIRNTDGRQNRKFAKEIKTYLAERGRAEFIRDVKMIAEKAITTTRYTYAFVFKMKNDDEITLFCDKKYKTIESVLAYFDQPDSTRDGFEIKVQQPKPVDGPIFTRSVQWRPERW